VAYGTDDVRIAGGVAAVGLRRRLRRITAQVNPNALIGSPLALDRVFGGDWYIAAAATFGGLVGVGILLALAACGIYSIMSFIGGALGTPIAWWAFSSTGDDLPGIATRFAASLLPGLAVMLAIGLVACTAPTLRALRVTPTEASQGIDAGGSGSV
jgi:hypothetical protein